MTSSCERLVSPRHSWTTSRFSGLVMTRERHRGQIAIGMVFTSVLASERVHFHVERETAGLARALHASPNASRVNARREGTATLRPALGRSARAADAPDNLRIRHRVTLRGASRAGSSNDKEDVKAGASE